MNSLNHALRVKLATVPWIMMVLPPAQASGDIRQLDEGFLVVVDPEVRGGWEECLLPEIWEGDQALADQVVRPGNAHNRQAAKNQHQRDDQGSCPPAPHAILPRHKGRSLLGLLETARRARKGRMAARA
jgi:hypothetical protein